MMEVNVSFKRLVDDFIISVCHVVGAGDYYNTWPEDRVSPDPNVSRPAPGLQNSRTLLMVTPRLQEDMIVEELVILHIYCKSRSRGVRQCSSTMSWDAVDNGAPPTCAGGATELNIMRQLHHSHPQVSSW
ncbi:hypothetical protein J6590_051219 [Homalodisca vitripennis]|nr:hypothetical protein J6590_051219 [Homalodisca vitripennis]